jgi:hypothetical protein
MLDERFIVHPKPGLCLVNGVEDTEPSAGHDTSLHEGSGCEQRMEGASKAFA